MWDKVCAEAGNCLGKKCEFYKDCFWQAARRRMVSTANVLVVNHALLFSDLALRMAGVNYLPKYDLLVLDEAHTVEDVAGQHFGLKVTEAGVRYALRSLYDPKRAKGMLKGHGTTADPAVADVIELHERCDGFFGRCVDWHAAEGRGSGRVREPGVVPDALSPKLRDLSLHLRGDADEGDRRVGRGRADVGRDQDQHARRRRGRHRRPDGARGGLLDGGDRPIAQARGRAARGPGQRGATGCGGTCSTGRGAW